MAEIESIAAEQSPRWATVPGFPDVDIIAWSDDGHAPSLVKLTCYGWPHDLVAAGLLPRQAFIMGSHRKRGARVDQDGTHWQVTSYWRQKDSGRRSRYFRISCRKPLPLARRVPGVNEALEVEARYRRWEDQREHERQLRHARWSAELNRLEARGVNPNEPFLRAMARVERSQHLKLVVDNTRDKENYPS